MWSEGNGGSDNIHKRVDRGSRRILPHWPLVCCSMPRGSLASIRLAPTGNRGHWRLICHDSFTLLSSKAHRHLQSYTLGQISAEGRHGAQAHRSRTPGRRIVRVTPRHRLDAGCRLRWNRYLSTSKSTSSHKRTAGSRAALSQRWRVKKLSVPKAPNVCRY